MANVLAIARPYAQALFTYATEQNQRAEYGILLNNLTCIVEHEEMLPVLANPLFDAKQQQQFIINLLGLEDMAMCQVIELLARNKRLPYAGAIADRFKQLCREADNTQAATITSAQALTKTQQKQLCKTLELRTGKTIEPDFQQDDSLIGGLTVKMGDSVEDRSISGLLNQLKNTLIFKEENNHATT